MLIFILQILKLKEKKRKTIWFWMANEISSSVSYRFKIFDPWPH